MKKDAFTPRAVQVADRVEELVLGMDEHRRSSCNMPSVMKDQLFILTHIAALEIRLKELFGTVSEMVKIRQDEPFYRGGPK